MKPAEYLDAAKARLCLSSDYALAKKMNVDRALLSKVKRGDRPMDPFFCTWVAITLELDPAHVIADIESQAEKNADRAAFWRSFLGRAAMVAMVAGTLALSSFDRSVSAPAFAGGLSAIIAAHLFYRRQTSDNVYYVKSQT